MSLVGDTSILIRAPELRRFAAAILQAAGVSGDIADEWAKCLVWANLRGTDSHGVLRSHATSSSWQRTRSIRRR